MRPMHLAAIVLTVLLLLPQARAADIVVDDPAWLKLSEAERAEVEKELKAIGALEPDDRIVVKPIKDNTISEQDFKDLLIQGGGAIAGGIKSAARKAGCSAKNLFNRDRCGQETDATKFKDCQARERSRHEAVAAKC